MKFDRGMATLVTLFSGVGALMCLLVGLQLLFLDSRIGQATAAGYATAELPLEQWRMLIRTGAVMSFGAGVMTFLFSLRHLAITKEAKKDEARGLEPVTSSPEVESISVRIFEVDAQNNSVEITRGTDEHPVEESRPRTRVTHTRHLAGPDLAAEIEPAGDPAESIVNSIREAAAPGSDRTAAMDHPQPSFFDRLFRRHGRH